MRYPAAALVCLLIVAGCGGSGPAWRELPRAPQARTAVAGVAIQGRVVALGGVTATGAPSRRVDLYDPRRERWTRLPSLPEPLQQPMVVAKRDRLYVLGGYRGAPGAGRASDRAWMLLDGSWRPLPPLPEPRAAGGAALVRNRIYVVGGVTGPEPGRLAGSTLGLDLSSLRWERLPALARPREGLGVTAYAGRVYAIGGRTAGPATSSAAAEVYDPSLGRWTALPDAPTRRSGNGAAVADRQVVVVGGEGPRGMVRAVEAFDPADGRWRSLPRDPRPRRGAAVAGVGRTVYQAMGGPRPGPSASGTLMALRVPRR